MHALVIAAIFIPYIGLMVALGTYIYRTGQPRTAGEPGDRDDEEREPQADALARAA